MDIKAKIEEVVKKLTSDKNLMAKFEKNPVKVIEELVGIDLPDDLYTPEELASIVRRSATILDVDISEVQEALERIRSYDPRPGQALSSRTAPVVVPEVNVVRNRRGQWEVVPGDAAFPSVAISDEYEKMQQDKSLPREDRAFLGRSIEERPEIVDTREEFGHWEIDTVIGIKDENGPCVLTLTERMTRMCFWIKARNRSADAIMEALGKVLSYFTERRDQVFKTITGDNGSEFASLSLLEEGELKVYFTHPYSSCEKGTNERHNRLLRRFIPKGKSISDYSADAICSFADCINGLPRKPLDYRTPDELLDEQLDCIYAA